MRILWMDNLKAIGIFLTLFVHIIPDGYLKHYIYSFPIPLFFFVSGYLFDRDKYDFAQFFRRKVRTIAIPYLFFAAFSFLFWFFVVRGFSIGGRALEVDPLKPFIGILYGVGTGEWRVPMNVALWFLTCLFVIEMVFYFVRSVYLLPVFAVLGYAVTFLPFRLPWGSDVALSGIVFYGFGYFFKDIWMSNRALPVLSAVHVGCCFLNSRTDMNSLEYGNIFLFYGSTLAGVKLYASLCRFIRKNMLMLYFGRNTLVILGMMGISWFVLNGILYLIFGFKVDLSGFGSAVAASALQILLIVPAIYCMNRWTPFILGKPRPHMLRDGSEWEQSEAGRRVAGPTT
jgi:fucose 4-O-acetylase-like acetyltransferase